MNSGGKNVSVMAIEKARPVKSGGDDGDGRGMIGDYILDNP